MGVMAAPGWYPDPEGSDTPQYWDGESWTTGPVDDPTRQRPLWQLIAVVLALTLLVIAVVWQPWRRNPWALPTDSNSALPSGRQWDELEPSETPTSPQPTDGNGRPVNCPIVDETALRPQGDWFISEGMKYQGVPGWDPNGSWSIDFASKRSGQKDNVTEDWVSITAIGQISKQTFSSDARTAAHQLSSCMATSYYYRTLSSVEMLEDRKHVTKDGVTGWLLRANFWNEPETQEVLGDEVVILVVETDSQEAFTLFHTQAPIGDQARQDLVAACLDSFQRA